MAIKGRGVSKGRARGVCKLVMNIQQLDRIQEGDILVTTMTNPDMVLAMGKCSAIITDVGGMTCHAAVISRELGIPCVVGTERATKTLSDGMLVEVDGSNGEIYFIKEVKPVIEEQHPGEKTYKIFGGNAKVVNAPMKRKKPFWADNWNKSWPAIEEGQFEWVIPRAEVINTPFTGSLIVQAIEKIPYFLGFEKIGPLYSQVKDDGLLYLRLDKTKDVVALLADKILSRDERFFSWYKMALHRSYLKLQEASKKFTEVIKNMSLNPNKSELLTGINHFKIWWGVHEEFFALTFFIQSMGDDIIWPQIEKMIKSTNVNSSEVTEYLTTVSLPTEDTFSTKFFNDVSTFIKNLSPMVKDVIFSNMEYNNIIRILDSLGDSSIRYELKNLSDKWWWMRDRDLYFEPLMDEEGLLRFIIKYFSKDHTKKRTLEENRKLLDTCLITLESKLKGRWSEFKFYLELGRFLHTERDNHHIFWLRDVAPVREYFARVGKYLNKEGHLKHHKDVFFLQIPEIIELLENGNSKATERIKPRMEKYVSATQIKFHQVSL